ncbi:MBL fold metallo-hydrolase [Catenisphaera adipataccumulans]|uniref:7, 8-dihydropterin-6-yl-methyl-4-(Beta-D-ribofuranosyl)aminobenzene 5'-phosphate synthase n=1 Tax=Catenisphaera adipataccumulans TaxID=700500 RepID=A0A7W8FVL7_9FIRM|nr:MBL fold metallo-hydrolase [Catenisphaera adipataccumulans]MBB5183744.1 7,8-dihydropterin-6-yl-methyl-4-(beta-D-ribofuranosyl)aminobenzene 5'-phosphate synthase [Catenisphaera adipataccumulans]
MIKITTLMDDVSSHQTALQAAHGLSYLVELANFRFIFDCGPDSKTWQNAAQLGSNLDHIDAVVLSHDHFDHAGGYRSLIEKKHCVPVLYTGSGFFYKKYRQEGIKYTDLSGGFGPSFISKHGIEYHEVQSTEKIAEGVELVSGFSRSVPFEKIPDCYVRQTAQGLVPDDFSDEICAVLHSPKGMIVLVGCAHPGIVNMIGTIKDRFQEPVYAIFGGIHLKAAADAQIKQTAAFLKAAGIQIFGFSHCTGTKAEQYLDQDPHIQHCHLAVGDCVFLS